MALSLPKFVFIASSDKKHLRYVKEAGSDHARLRFSEDTMEVEAELPYIKFEVEEAKVGEGLVHLRTCYNNKYLASKSADSKYIVAESNEPEEDQSKWSCTLFKPVFVDDQVNNVINNDDDPKLDNRNDVRSWKIRLVHIDESSEHSAFASKTNATEEEVDNTFLDLAASDVDTAALNGGDVFFIFDATSLGFLPNYIALMGVQSKYAHLITHSSENLPVMDFNPTDIASPGAALLVQNIIHEGEPFVAIKSIAFGRWFVNVGTLFSPLAMEPVLNGYYRAIKLGGDLAALQSLATGRFSTSYGSYSGHYSELLMFPNTTITEDAKLRGKETVLRRQISNVVYDVANIRIYNMTPIEHSGYPVRNETDLTQTHVLIVSYKKTNMTYRRESAEFNWSISVSWSSPQIPFLGSGGVEFTTGGSQGWEWGAETTVETEASAEQPVAVLPWKMVTLYVTATQASYDIPFTCTVTDVMTDGTTRVYTKNDGLFSGTNGYNFDTRLVQSDLI